MEKSPGHFVLHFFHVPPGVTQLDVHKKHFMHGRPDIKADPNAVGGLLLSEHLSHNVIHDLNLSRIQSHGSSFFQEPLFFENIGSIGELTPTVKCSGYRKHHEIKRLFFSIIGSV